MMRHLRILTAVTILNGMICGASVHADTGHLHVKIGGLAPDGRLPDQAAFCPPPSSTVKNISPAIEWSAGPDGTQSYALLMIDIDVPKDFSQINKAGTIITEESPRITVHHWVLVDIPAAITSLASGVESDGLVPHGKPIGETDHGRRGFNVFTSFLSTHPDMAGTYGGYDGPCPPVNDEQPHRYIVRIFALDVPTLGLHGAFDGPTAENAMQGHILAQSDALATYTLNPRLMPKATQ
ncbi:MAG: YbhB/YbcL family Raf kinase inhibitor-like protein [Rhodospirillaceae bacterium]|uniref:YbhB/YbcL family Raf kinase inhibitor-like protein n=1 Tax=unclassified Hwanghaeella TaxID=2605944 RepID=UPI000C48C4CB|nr:YbhB/YbcL family Raf kinase inhibitor-like protein [Rhodospirillales bacterium]MAX48263.1 YbhB/YbcL family Raf kinase inhibitor-like protein [Rhodospirillaceae bacterium]|tara:strand:+ start:44602 stop:45315 length:714 start_codon:yes stop_codon:yes gene_type:complete